jgi:RNA polymerase sigma-70 factor (ECF subfamily)
VALLAVRTRDISAAEDAIADAFCGALETWPISGAPERPEAWLLTVARRRLIDAERRLRVREGAAGMLTTMTEAAVEERHFPAQFPDERLRLLFACAHPAIDAAIHAPLMLQTVLGLDAARIASTFVVQPSAMTRRLSRAKRKIRDAGIGFEPPEPDELESRLKGVLDALYAAFGVGWENISGANPDLCDEVIELARLVCQLSPAEPEAMGLLALMLHCEARRRARRTSAGAFVPLTEQNPALWSRPMIAEAEQWLSAASRENRIGRYQLEAAIQSVHAQRLHTGKVEWGAISLLYEGLARIAPTIGNMVGRAAAMAESHDIEEAFACLAALPEASIKTYQPYWALRAHLLRRVGQETEAQAAYRTAIGLAEEPAVREFLLTRIAVADSRPLGIQQ